MKMHHDFYSGLVVLALCAIGVYGAMSSDIPATNGPINPLSLSWVAIIGCSLCAVILLIQSLKKQAQNNLQSLLPVIKTLLFFLFFVAYMAGMIFIGNKILESNDPFINLGGGFLISSPLFLALAFFILGRRNIFEILSIPAIVAGILLYIFGFYFNIILP